MVKNSAKRKEIFMKKIIILSPYIIIFLIYNVFAQDLGQYLANIVQYKIVFNGEQKDISNPIVTINDRTYLPVREVAEMLAIDIQWDDETQTILINSERKEYGEDWLVFKQDGKYGYMDKQGNIKIEAQFDLANDFIDGVALVGNYLENWTALPSGANNKLWGFVGVDGNLITPITFQYAGEFSDGLALVTDRDGESYYIDKYGNKSSQKVIADKFFTEGVAPKLIKGGYVGPPMPNPPEEVWSYVDSNGTLATNQEFEGAGYFSDGLAIVKKNDKFGVINESFNTVIDYKYNNLNKIDTTLFAAKKGERWGIIDVSDNVIADFEYLYIGEFSEGLAPVGMNLMDGVLSDSAYIAHNGEIFLDMGFQLTDKFIDGYACVCDKRTKKYGVIDHLGNYVIAPQYDYLKQQKTGVFQVQDKENIDYYYIDLQGNSIKPKID